MSSIAVASLKYSIRFYGCELMPNHLHMVVSATGSVCNEVFSFLRRRINLFLKEDGFPLLPENYGFKLISIDSRESMQAHLVYLARNAYEKGLCTPCGHKWGSGYLLYNELSWLIRGTKVKDLSQRAIFREWGIRDALPPEWEIHPELGILPSNFIDTDKVRSFFPSVKDYMTRLVKDYESYVRISAGLGETIEWSYPEVRDIVKTAFHQEDPGGRLEDWDNEKKCRLAVKLNDEYGISASFLAKAMGVPERIVLQSLRSKDYGIRKR